MMINWLRNAERFDSERGVIFTGPQPFGHDVEKWNDDGALACLFQRPWVISHPTAMDKLWRVKGIEMFANTILFKDMQIGLWVEEWK